MVEKGRPSIEYRYSTEEDDSETLPVSNVVTIDFLNTFLKQKGRRHASSPVTSQATL
jgi:hypothetical protein